MIATTSQLYKIYIYTVGLVHKESSSGKTQSILNLGPHCEICLHVWSHSSWHSLTLRSSGNNLAIGCPYHTGYSIMKSPNIFVVSNSLRTNCIAANEKFRALSSAHLIQILTKNYCLLIKSSSSYRIFLEHVTTLLLFSDDDGCIRLKYADQNRPRCCITSSTSRAHNQYERHFYR